MAISVTRGDSLILEVDIKHADGTEYTLQSGDVLTLTVKPDKRPSTAAVIQKTANSTTGAEFELEPAETAIDYGTYWFDVELSQANGRRFTVCKPDKFKVTEEVTTHGVG